MSSTVPDEELLTTGYRVRVIGEDAWGINGKLNAWP